MSAQSSFAFQPKAAANDEVFVPDHDALMRYAAGELTGDQIGLHNIYSCQLEDCPQCDARLAACFEFEEMLDAFDGGIEV